ncbi:MAG TPA: conjugal transfer protein TraG N-terminal domain-containing protein [Deltaproteobacteria bacterium]|nr:conjugal transfer protein TraG N-terminal domain-containing protein [Deltaproteobacteria bacterium]
MIRKSFPAISILLFFLIFLATPVSADEASVVNEFGSFTTYGGTNDVVADGFQRLSMIMNHPQFQNGFVVTMLLAFVIGGAITALRTLGTLNGGLAPWLTWFGSIILGMVILATFFVPTGQVRVWDATTNDTRTVDNVPEGVLLVAGMFNRIETGLIGFVDVAGLDGMTYASGAGGIGIAAVASLFSGNPSDTTFPSSLSSSLNQYCTDCVFFELQREGTTLRPESFYSPPNNAITTALGLAASPAVSTMYYYNDTAGNPLTSGIMATCQEAWNGGTVTYNGTSYTIGGLRNELASMNANDFFNQQCAAAGFDPNSAAALNRCQALIRETLNRMMVGAGSLVGNTNSNITQNFVISKSMQSAIMKADKATQIRMDANSRIVSAGIAAGLMANDFIPAMRATMLCLFLGMFPFLCFMIPTPLMWKALSILFWSFSFLCFWGVCDAVVNDMALDHAIKVFREIRQDQLGMANMFLIPNTATRALAFFGGMRFLAIMFAATISSILFKFGSAIGHFAGRVGADVQGAGTHAGSLAFDPVQGSASMKAYAEAPSNFMAVGTTVSNYSMEGYTAGHASQNVQSNVAGVSRAQHNRAAFGGDVAAGDGIGFGGHMSDVSSFKNAEAITTASSEAGYSSPMAYLADKYSRDHRLSANEMQYINQNYQGGMAQFASDQGNISGAEQAGKTTAYKGVGLSGVQTSAEMSGWEGKARELAPLIGAQLKEKGHLYGNVADAVQNMTGDPEGLAALNSVLSAPMSSVHTAVNGKEEAKQVQALAAKSGMHVPLDMIQGAKLTMNLGFDNKGNMAITQLGTSKGFSATSEAMVYQRSGQHISNFDNFQEGFSGSKDSAYVNFSQTQGGSISDSFDLSRATTGNIKQTYKDAENYQEGLNAQYSPLQRFIYNEGFQIALSRGATPEQADQVGKEYAAYATGFMQDSQKVGAMGHPFTMAGAAILGTGVASHKALGIEGATQKGIKASEFSKSKLNSILDRVAPQDNPASAEGTSGHVSPTVKDGSVLQSAKDWFERVGHRIIHHNENPGVSVHGGKERSDYEPGERKTSSPR